MLFKARYQSFKQLIAANNRALAIMADMEQALMGKRAFGMPFVRSAVTASSVNVFKMVKNLKELAPGKYGGLTTAFSAIQQQIDGLLKIPMDAEDARWVIFLEDIQPDMAQGVGLKMGNLAELNNRLHLPIPQGFVVTASAYRHFMAASDLQTEIDRMLQSADPEDFESLVTLSAQIQQNIIQSGIPADLDQCVCRALSAIDSGQGPLRLAVRSSALGEDMAGSSFAGQYRSELNVGANFFWDAYKTVVASKYSLQAMAYRLARGFRDEDIAMAVGCLVMVEAKAGGVMYTKNPVDPSEDAVFINAAWGLPKTVVDGVGDCDLYVVAKSKAHEILRQRIGDKTSSFSCDANDGVCRETVSDPLQQRQPALLPKQAAKLGKMAAKLEDHYKTPQDIEWALTRTDELVLLQCRPLSFSRTATLPEPEKRLSSARLLLAGGQTASPGMAAGKVFLVEKSSDIIRFPKNAVLVTKQALPAWAPVLNRAAAVVTEQGGFAGHLANVAREFGIPAIFGLAHAVANLKNGEEITVDADGRTVYKGTLPLPDQKQPPAPAMAGSPVFETLKNVSRFIVPLHLLDPEARTFTPDNCRTFHDITRFVHEKSVQEMFSFGREHHFSERSGKQLHYRVPMQWWILNLDDGFKSEVTGKYVRLENIVSIPMLAFWEGFAAVPWDGPPAIDGRGLAAVMFGATTNTALNTGLRSKYSEKNYFMISKYYMSLNSRLGFHFSILETVVGRRQYENYISFQFKGGAANLDRRLRRVVFIGDLLENYGFRVSIKEDTLTARVDQQKAREMLQMLKVLGYLTLHTRQLDMIMTSPTQVAYYLGKMKHDMDTVIFNKQ